MQRIVICAGCVALMLGQVIIMTVPVGPGLRLAAAVLWLLISARELVVIAKGHKRCRRIRIASSGDVELLTKLGDWQVASLCNGSMVLTGLAWLRIDTCDGQRVAVLLRGNANENKEWRRLQVIWRHLGAAH